MPEDTQDRKILVRRRQKMGCEATSNTGHNATQRANAQPEQVNSTGINARHTMSLGVAHRSSIRESAQSGRGQIHYDSMPVMEMTFVMSMVINGNGDHNK